MDRLRSLYLSSPTYKREERKKDLKILLFELKTQFLYNFIFILKLIFTAQQFTTLKTLHCMTLTLLLKPLSHMGLMSSY